MALRFALIFLALLVLVYAPLPTSAAPLELNEAALAEGNIVPEVGPTPSPAPSEPGKQKQRTFFLLLPLLFPDQFYF
ncbi:uncharacterized protein [Drosophila virilis]|uniref:Uncharacterized protein n=1 Tax=Drosophila virilis TaxID=7244 RepID=A0A0Q9WS36_DROVI|nr:uncharacterized protein LOC26531305 [Drosophila virilis]KRF83556.1 uncharacterized protein Dvir_GJ26535 [Drosophila virilis]